MAAEPDVVEGEFAGGKLGDQNRACIGQARDDRCIHINDAIFERRGAPSGRIALRGVEIFYAPGNSVQRAAIVACGDFLIGLPGLAHGQVFGDGHGAEQLRIQALQAREIHFRQLDGSRLLRANQFRELRHWPVSRVFEILRAIDRFRRARAHGALGPIDFDARKNRIEIERGGDAIIELHFSQIVVNGKEFVHALEHATELLIGEAESGDGCRIAEH